MIRAGIIGATGYTGAELVRLLSGHEDVEIEFLSSRQYAGKLYSDIYPCFRKKADIIIEEYNPEKIAGECDVVFTALPHQIPMGIIPELIDKGLRVLDLSADFRFSSREIYEEFYCPHLANSLIKKSVYGLCEINRELIKESFLVGNPGCYPTCSLLAVIPFLKGNIASGEDIIIDAKSGASGAGRGLSLGTHFCELDGGFKAYKVASHRHRPEIEEKIFEFSGIKADISFTPHLIPIVRGMLCTSYLKVKSEIDESEIRKYLENFYSGCEFVRILGEGVMPDIKNVAGSNYCDINFKYDRKANRLIVVSVIDNLVKGASGQGVQNMNIMFDLFEGKGLDSCAYPV
ncbi:MAG: N-acetyl-gamma-glutamyl-phosphate reductase [Deltaproteobacteria bacterium]|nr:MAG: N-acetyl-gamma-glutamyl-phosphate reductase [Deltaproteobacteria bacterium]